MLINKDLLKRFGIFPQNMDLTEVMNYVDISEIIYIIPLIGNAQYDELCEQVKDNNLTPENSTLLVEAVYPLLCMAVAYESCPMLWSHLSEVGWTLGKSDNSDSLSLKDMTWITEHLKRQIQARGDYAIQWIKDRIEYYPLIAECQGCKCSCCNEKELYKPRTFQQLYTPFRRNTNLK